MYKLKNGQESITIVDGPDAGRVYKRGVVYDRPAACFEHLFEKAQATEITEDHGKRKPEADVPVIKKNKSKEEK